VKKEEEILAVGDSLAGLFIAAHLAERWTVALIENVCAGEVVLVLATSLKGLFTLRYACPDFTEQKSFE
jgi:hypothetical protein